MSDKNMNAKVKVNFTKASTRQNITSGENISTSFGKISKYLDDLGTAAFTNSSDYATLTDLSDKVDKATGKELMPSDLLDANGDVALSHLPDIVLGQMIYGGTVNASNVATLSTNAKTKLGTTSNTITLTNNTTAITGYVANEGIYYIATGNATLANLGIKTGDWLLSTGSAWSKIDNTDEVSSVNSKTGAVTLNASDVSAVSTSANQGLTDTQKANARTNIGAGTSSFDGDYNSLSNTPTIPPAVAVKGNAESTYRTGNVNLTPTNIGAATSAQGTKADSAVQTIKMNGNAVTKTSGVVDLGTVITAHQDISGKADKSATVSNVTYDTTNKKLTKTINGTTSDIVTTAKLKTDMALSKSDVGLSNVGNFKAVSTAASQGLTDTEKANARTNIGAGTSSFSGSYNDLSNKPTIPTVNNGTLTIQKNGTNVATFTANQSGNSTANIAVPTKVSELTNDSGYTTNTGTVTQVKVGSTAYNPSSGVISLPAYPTKSSLGLDNVNNTSDADKPISIATQTALDGKAPLTSNNSIDYVSSGVTWNDSSSNTYDRMSTYVSRNKTAWLVSNPAYDIGIGLAADDSKAWIEAWVDYPSNTSNGLIEFYDTYIDIRKDDNTEPILRLSKSPSTVDSIWNHGNKSIIMSDSTISIGNGNKSIIMDDSAISIGNGTTGDTQVDIIGTADDGLAYASTLSVTGDGIQFHNSRYDINLFVMDASNGNCSIQAASLASLSGGDHNITLTNNGITFDNITIPYANNAGFHNSIFRGKYLGNSYTAAQKAQVQAGTFDDLFIGDYWTINGINWRIAHFDYYLNTGDTQCTKHHIVVVPDTNITTSYMNSTNITTNAYVGSYMYTTTLLQDGTEADSSVFGKIKAAFGESNLLSIRQLFSNDVDSNGDLSGWSWYSTRCFLMNQSQVYGQKAWPNGNNDGYNVGIDKNQLALFAHDTSTINRRYTYWLRDVRGSADFAYVRNYGNASYGLASGVFGVRPVALLS